jgi:hypothetical protein
VVAGTVGTVEPVAVEVEVAVASGKVAVGRSQAMDILDIPDLRIRLD